MFGYPIKNAGKTLLGWNPTQTSFPELVKIMVAHDMANNTYRADFIYKNLQIQQNIIGESYRHGVKKLLFLGSTCIYPRDAQQPIKEEEKPDGTMRKLTDPSKLHALGWHHQIEIEEGVQRMYRWYLQ